MHPTAEDYVLLDQLIEQTAKVRESALDDVRRLYDYTDVEERFLAAVELLENAKRDYDQVIERNDLAVWYLSEPKLTKKSRPDRIGRYGMSLLEKAIGISRPGLFEVRKRCKTRHDYESVPHLLCTRPRFSDVFAVFAETAPAVMRWHTVAAPAIEARNQAIYDLYGLPRAPDPHNPQDKGGVWDSPALAYEAGCNTSNIAHILRKARAKVA